MYLLDQGAGQARAKGAGTIASSLPRSPRQKRSGHLKDGGCPLVVPSEMINSDYTEEPAMATATAKVIDVQEFINSHKLSAAQIVLLVLCFLIVAIDGFDTAAIGFIAPAIRAEWGVTPAQLAPLFGSGLFGLMVG